MSQDDFIERSDKGAHIKVNRTPEIIAAAIEVLKAGEVVATTNQMVKNNHPLGWQARGEAYEVFNRNKNALLEAVYNGNP